MNSVKAKYLTTDISIKPTKTIDQVASDVSKALSINLKINQSGKFEEFIGYECNSLGMNIRLLSDPSSPQSDYDLGIYGQSKNGGEAVDITDFILALLNKNTDLQCEKML